MELNYVTLTNAGYRDLTANLCASIERLSCNINLTIYTMDQESYDYFSGRGYVVVDVRQTEPYLVHNLPCPTDWVPYMAAQSQDIGARRRWSEATFNKIIVVYNELCTKDHVVFVDGDIVILRDPTEQFEDTSKDIDLIVQNDECDNNDHSKWCSGFFYIRSTEFTRKIFNPATINVDSFINDQNYLRSKRKDLKYKVLDLDLFPNGKYFRTANPKNPYIIHFNHDVGEGKIKRIKKYNHWYI